MSIYIIYIELISVRLYLFGLQKKILTKKKKIVRNSK